MGPEFQFGKMTKFSRWKVIMIGKQCEDNVMNCTLKNGENDQFHVTYIL